MTDPKVLFVKKFLAELFHKDITTIPINNDKFQKGIDRMADYFDGHKENFGPYKDELESLFLKYNTRGEYLQFARTIESFNGRIVSLENPHYVKANIRLEKDYADELVHNEELKMEEDCFKKLVSFFQEVAIV